DYRPLQQSKEKIKKGNELNLTLVQNPDILAELGRLKKRQIIVGFAAETGNLRENAVKKLTQKNLDLIVANNVLQEGAGFAVDTNIIQIFFRNGEEKQFPKKTKQQAAKEILNAIQELIKENPVN